MRHIRIKKRRASDGTIGLKKIFEPFYEKFEDKKARKKMLKEEYNECEYLPHFRKRLHQSMMWERYDLKQEDEIDFHQKLFRSNETKLKTNLLRIPAPGFQNPIPYSESPKSRCNSTISEECFSSIREQLCEVVYFTLIWHRDRISLGEVRESNHWIRKHQWSKPHFVSVNQKKSNECCKRIKHRCKARRWGTSGWIR